MNNIGTKTLETDRLTLRRFKLEDAKELYEGYVNQEDFLYYANKEKISLQDEINSLKVIEEKYNNPEYYNWVITLKNGKIIGSINLNVDSLNESVMFNYAIDNRYKGNGYMTEALMIVKNYCLNEIKVNKISGGCEINNIASKRVMEKCGFIYEETIKNYLKLKDGYHDIYLYSITNDKIIMKNVLLIHGFNGIPKIFEYFKRELERKDYNVIMPEFPIREEITVEGYYKIFDKYKDVFNSNIIVVAHSIGNPMFIKYISKNNCMVGKYISLAGFSKDFFNEGKDVLNEKVKLAILNDKEIYDAKTLIKDRYSIYSKDDHVVPYELLKEFSKDIDSKSISIEGIGHMGKKSGLEELPVVIDIICNEK